MQITVLGRTLTIGAPQVVLAGLAIVFVMALLTAGVTATAPFGAYNADWTGTSEFRNIADEDGRTVVVASNATLPSDTPPNQTALVMLGVGPTETQTQQALRRFVAQGGTLIVAADAGSPSNTVLETAGARARIQTGHLRDPREYYRSPALPLIEPTEEIALPANTRITLNHAGVVSVNGATVMARTSSFAYIDRNRNEQFDSDESLGRRAVMTTESVGDGKVVVISDSSVFVNAMLERDGNEALARTLLAEHQTVILSTDGSASATPPVATALLTVRREPILQLLTLLPVVGVVIIVRRYLERTHTRVGAGPSDSADGDRTLSPAEIQEPANSPAQTEGFVATLIRDHPTWDRQRLTRVVRAARNRTNSNDDEHS
jgi:hypothetical protein